MVEFSPLPLSTRCIDGVRIRAREPSSRPTAIFGGDISRRPTTMAERRNTRTPVFAGSFWRWRDRRGEKGPVETGRLTTVTKRRRSYLLVLSGDANGANIYGRFTAVGGGMPKIGPKKYWPRYAITTRNPTIYPQKRPPTYTRPARNGHFRRAQHKVCPVPVGIKH